MAFSNSPLLFDDQGRIIVERPINWNKVEDQVDADVWHKLTSQFWLPERIALSNDMKSWNQMTSAEQDATNKVFTGLSGLDTLQGHVGAPALVKDAVTQHEVAVMDNIAFMEAFSGETELLTPSGWKSIEDITEADQVAQYDPDTNNLTFVTPNVVPSHYADEVYEIAGKNGNSRQVVSGGHRVFFEEREELTNSCKTWKPRVLEAREFASINYSSAFRRMRTTGTAPSNPDVTLTVEDRLKIAIQADGSFKGGSSPRYTGERNGVIPVSFTFAKGRKKERLTELAEKAHWELRRQEDDGTRSFYKLMVPVDHIGDRDKHFDAWWSLDAVSVEWAQEFIAESGLWDGHTLKGGYGVTYYTVDKRNADFYVAIASLAGYRTRCVLRQDDRSDTFSDSYVVNVSYSKSTVNGQSLSVQKVEPREVYCVQVPSSYLLTRNGESPVISGNCVHAKSYSYINATLLSSEDQDFYWRWFAENEQTQKKIKTITDFYYGRDPLMKKAASTILESFLFYSGFYMPLHWSSVQKLTNTADLIRLIIRDESVHGYYIGYKFQRSFRALTSSEQDDIENETKELLYELYENEVAYTEDIYDPLGLTEDVKAFLHYNANKALMNLGFDVIFPKEATQVDPAILSSLTLGSETHDFFSGAGSSYTMGRQEDMTEDDWDF